MFYVIVLLMLMMVTLSSTGLTGGSQCAVRVTGFMLAPGLVVELWIE